MKIESDGLRVYDNTGKLRGVFGSWLKELIRKYGIKIIDGEIYSTLFRTGGEDDTTYVELNQDGVLKCIKNGNRTAQLDAYASDGRLVLYRYDGEPSCYLNAYYGFDTYAGVGLSAVNLYDSDLILSSGGADLILHGTGTHLSTPGEFYVSNDAFINGDLSCTGAKPAIHQTKSYGLRAMYARESPNLKFIEEGVSKLTAGECKIFLDPIFLETVEQHTDQTPWSIFCTPYADIGLYIAEIGENYIIIRERDGGVSNSYFSWSMSAYRKGFAHLRMKEYNAEEDYLSSNWEDEFVLTASSEEDLLTSRWEDELID